MPIFRSFGDFLNLNDNSDQKSFTGRLFKTHTVILPPFLGTTDFFNQFSFPSSMFEKSTLQFN